MSVFYPTDEQTPVLIWDSFDVDLLITVAELSILHPLFSMWVPIVTRAQFYPSNSLEYRLSLLYFLTTLAISLFRWSSTIHLNKSWRSPSPLMALFGAPTLDWREQIVVVTGGSSGVGRCLVETMGVMRATVVVIDKMEYKPEFDDVYFYQCDLSSQSQIDDTVKKIQEEVGHPTILINNAGIVNGKLIVDLSAQEVNQTFAVNVFSQFALIKAFLPNMIENKKGHIVTISSIFGLTAAAQLSDYVASKFAVVGLHETLRAELKTRYEDPPIRTTLVLPGRLHTPLFSSLRRPSRFINFIFPTIEPHVVAKRVVAELEKERSGEIHLPRAVGWVWGFKILGSIGRDFVESFTGVHVAMKDWKKSSSSPAVVNETEKDKDL